MADMVNVLIDGKPIAVEKGTLVIEAARRLGIMVPLLLPPQAHVRRQLPHVPGRDRKNTEAADLLQHGVHRGHGGPDQHARRNEAHQSVLEFILANHPLDCPICDQGGRCDLQTSRTSTRPRPASSATPSACIRRSSSAR